MKLKEINQLIATSKASTIPVEGIQGNTFAGMGLFLLISLILGVILFFSRHRIIDIISKIGSIFRNIIEKYLFKIPNFERYYNQGFFLLHWTLVWLVCRLTVIKPIYETLMVDSESLVLQIFIQVLSIVLAMVIALIPVTLLTCWPWINDWISVLHFLRCSDNRLYIQFILRLHVIRCRIYRSKVMMLVTFIILFMLFMAYLITNEKMLLFVFLSVIYSKLYVENFTLKVMPNATVLRNFSTKLPITYFLANFKFRYWNNKVPIMLGGATFEPDYYFESISRDQYLALKSLYDDILFMEYVTDSSIPPQERLKIYTAVIKPIEGKKDGAILRSIKADIERVNSITSMKKEKLGSNTRNRSFHTSSFNKLPMEDGGLGETSNDRVSSEVRLAVGELNPGIRDLLHRIPLRGYDFGEYVGTFQGDPINVIGSSDERVLTAEEALNRILSDKDNSPSGSVYPQGNELELKTVEDLLDDMLDNGHKLLTPEELLIRKEHDQRMLNLRYERELEKVQHDKFMMKQAREMAALELQTAKEKLTHGQSMSAQEETEMLRKSEHSYLRRTQQFTKRDLNLISRRWALAMTVGGGLVGGLMAADSFYQLSQQKGTLFHAFAQKMGSANSINTPLPENSGGESKSGN